MNAQTHSVPEVNLERLKSRLDALIKRAAKLEVPPITYQTAINRRSKQ